MFNRYYTLSGINQNNFFVFALSPFTILHFTALSETLHLYSSTFPFYRLTIHFFLCYSRNQNNMRKEYQLLMTTTYDKETDPVLSREDAIAILNTPDDQLQDLVDRAAALRYKYKGNRVSISTIPSSTATMHGCVSVRRKTPFSCVPVKKAIPNVHMAIRSGIRKIAERNTPSIPKRPSATGVPIVPELEQIVAYFITLRCSGWHL